MAFNACRKRFCSLPLLRKTILKPALMPTETAQRNDIIGRLYENKRAMLLAIFRKAYIPEEDGKDLVQEVFVKLMTIDIILPNHLTGLIVTIAYQMRVDWLRHHAYCCRRQKQYTPQTATEPCELECRQLLQAERKVINRMSKSDAWVYQLSRFEDKSPSEITTITHYSLRAVEGRLYRTRKMVRLSLRAAGF